MKELADIIFLGFLKSYYTPLPIWCRAMLLTAILLTSTTYSTLACHDSQITNLVVVNNGNGTFTYTIDLTIDVGSFDGYGYGFALVFSNSTLLPPTVQTAPSFTPTVTRPGYDPLVGYTGPDIGSGPVPFFSERYAGRTDVLTYETTDDWFGMGSTDYSATITVTVAGCIEEISVDGDFRSLGNGIGDPSCVHTISTGYTCCPGPIPTGIVNATICPGETFVYFGSLYDENNLSGTELLSTPLGCDSLVTVNVTVDQNCCDPQTSAISGPTPLCQNATGNVYSVVNTAGSTYNWGVPSGATITSGQGSNSITVEFGMNGGQISVVESLQCGDGPTITFNVALDPIQTLVINDPASVCEPNTVDLTSSSITAGSTGGGTLSYWTNAAATIPLSNPNAVATTGTYYIQAGTGNCADIDAVSVTIDVCCDPQTSAISGPSPVCQGSGGHVYSVLNTSGSTYNWIVPAGATITSGQGSNSITVDFDTTGGQLTVVESLQCGDGPTVTFNVVLDPAQNLVITDPAAICSPNTVDLTVAAITVGSTGGGNLTYWTNAGATSPLGNPNAVATSGTYYIQSGSGNCSDVEPVNVIVNNCVSCTMNVLSLTMSNCYISGQGNLEFDLEGVLTYSDAPSTGVLTITDCFGNQQTFNPPFNGTQQFSVTGLPQDGLNCDFTANFSDDPSCTITTGFVAPPSITYFETNCVTGSGQVDGTLAFNNPPSTGTIVVEIFDGTTTQTTSIQPPFNSPEAWQVSGLDPGSSNYEVSYYFSDFPSCGQSQTIICGCSAVGGTTSASITGSGINDFVLCDGDQLDIETNNDFVFPEDIGPLVDNNGNQYPYQPGYVFLVYTCPPTSGVFPGDDPCFEGVVPAEGSMTDVNDPNSIFAQFPNGTFANNQLFYVPVTLYHYDPVAPAFIFNANCWAIGNVISVTYLPPVITDVTESCQSNAVSVTISGGYPEVFGGEFTASNLSPANATFANITTGNGGAIEVEGLQNGDMYSFDITDGNGCPVTISGGPFEALPLANAGLDDQNCTLQYDFSAIASHGIGTWSGGPMGTTFSSNNPDATVAVPAAGTYTFTWTEDNGNGCVTSDEVDITFGEMSMAAVVTNASCGASDGQISITPAGGLAPYSYTWSSGGSAATETNLEAGSVTVSVTDNEGCGIDSTFTITQPVTFNYTQNSSDASCAGSCNGSIDIQPDGAGPYTYLWTPNVSTSNSAADLCEGDYEVLVSDQNGCTQIVGATVNGSSTIVVQTTSDVNEICIGGSASLSSIVSGGVQPYGAYLWTAVPADPNLNPNVPNPTVSPATTTTYTLVVTDANGCVSTPKFVTIEVLAPLNLDVVMPFAEPDTSICPGGSATINLEASGGDGNWNIYLLPDDQNPVALPFETQPNTTVTYEFMVTDGCETPAAYASSTITVLEVPQVQISAEPNSGCAPITVEFSDLTQPSAQSWNWDFGDPTSNANSAQVEQPSHVFENPGSYDITLSVITVEGCSVETVFTDYVEVFDVPTAQFESSEEFVSLLNAEIDFTDFSEGEVDSWYWDFGDGQSSLDQNPTHNFREPGTYPVVLQVITENGCEDETYLEIEVEPDFTFYIPNAFTPNGDRHNNFFRGYGEGVNWDTYSMSITNRWGELIYQTNNIEAPWDGSFKGQQVELGVYVYEISFFDITGDDHYYYGHVKLVR
ncbi:PKD domain-containing protein [Flavobacteriales bacterium]|nr:PKD domain-containing protein [Flavobacteriales bacterium]